MYLHQCLAGVKGTNDAVRVDTHHAMKFAILILLAATLCATKTCVPSINHPPYDASQCAGLPLTPFCSEDSSGQTNCAPCTPYRKDGFCDCPAGYFCQPFTGSVNPNTPPAGVCVYFNRNLQQCTTPQDCDAWAVGAGSEFIYLDRFSCVAGFCRQCNLVRVYVLFNWFGSLTQPDLVWRERDTLVRSVGSGNTNRFLSPGRVETVRFGRKPHWRRRDHCH